MFTFTVWDVSLPKQCSCRVDTRDVNKGGSIDELEALLAHHPLRVRVSGVYGAVERSRVVNVSHRGAAVDVGDAVQPAPLAADVTEQRGGGGAVDEAVAVVADVRETRVEGD